MLSSMLSTVLSLKKYLPQKSIVLSIQATEKEAIIEEILDRLIERSPNIKKEIALQDLLTREAKMSTGIEQGVAIPHCKTEAVGELHAILVISREGKDFKSLDGFPSHIFVMMLSPKNKSGPHIEFLAAISQVLKSKKTRERIVNAPSAGEVSSILHDA